MNGTLSLDPSYFSLCSAPQAWGWVSGHGRLASRRPGCKSRVPCDLGHGEKMEEGKGRLWYPNRKELGPQENSLPGKKLLFSWWAEILWALRTPPTIGLWTNIQFWAGLGMEERKCGGFIISAGWRFALNASDKNCTFPEKIIRPPVIHTIS